MLQNFVQQAVLNDTRRIEVPTPENSSNSLTPDRVHSPNQEDKVESLRGDALAFDAPSIGLSKRFERERSDSGSEKGPSPKRVRLDTETHLVSPQTKIERDDSSDDKDDKLKDNGWKFCFDFRRSGKCQFGSKCAFKHIPPGEQIP